MTDTMEKKSIKSPSLASKKIKKDISVGSCCSRISEEKAKLVKRKGFFFTYTNNLFGFSHTLDFELSWFSTQLLQWDHCISTKLLRRKTYRHSLQVPWSSP
jgi:hypothetical protein